MAQDSVWEQSKKVAQEIKAAALSHSFSTSSSDAKKKEMRAEPTFIPSPPLAPNEVADSSFSAFSVEPMHSVDRMANNKISFFGVENVLDLPKTPQVEPPAFFDRLKTFFASRKPREPDDTSSLKPIQRGVGLRAISWPTALALCVLGLGILIVLAAVLFPYGSYLPAVEAALTQSTGQVAKVGEMRVGLYPKPGLFLSDVRFADAGEGKEIRILEMRLLPVLGTMTSSRKIFRELELRGVTLPVEALAGLSGMFDAAAQPSARAVVQHVTLEKVDISYRGMVIPELNGEIRLASDNRFSAVALHSLMGNLQLEAKPAATGIDVQLETYGWRPSPTSLFVLDSGDVKGNLTGATLMLSKIDLRVFDGVVQGSAVLGAEKKPSITGEILFERISAKRLGVALGIGAQFEGETTGKMKFSALADSWPSLSSSINGEGDFIMRRGVLGAIDLAEAVRRNSEAPTQGGLTRFESMSGRFKLAPDSYRFSGLALSSGLMQSVGQISVSKDLQVSGNLEVQMRGTANQLRMPVLISGALKAPLVQAGKR